MVKIQHKLSKMVESINHFTTHQWNFSDDNTRNLLTQMSQEDRKRFQIDVTEINWEKYMENYVLGVREFMFKQDSTSLPSCRKTVSRSVLICRLVFFFIGYPIVFA